MMNPMMHLMELIVTFCCYIISILPFVVIHSLDFIFVKLFFKKASINEWVMTKDAVCCVSNFFIIVVYKVKQNRHTKKHQMLTCRSYELYHNHL